MAQGRGASEGYLAPVCMQEEMQNNVEVVHTYRQHIVNDLNPGNLHLFINAYNRYGAIDRVPLVGLERGARQRGLREGVEDAAPEFEQIDCGTGSQVVEF